jgi:hypothetical protein
MLITIVNNNNNNNKQQTLFRLNRNVDKLFIVWNIVVSTNFNR